MTATRPLRVLIVPDKFKGTLSATQAAGAIARGWTAARPGDALRQLPLTDGGDGFGDCLRRLLGATRRTVRTTDAAGRDCLCPWWWHPRRRQAVVESARCIGLAMLPRGRFHPRELDTFGLARVLRAAADSNARSCVVGIGGSATNDGGFGLARGLGWIFLDRRGRELRQWPELRRLQRIVGPASPVLEGMRITVATDVQNPLLGPRGATRVYGPQKGLQPRELASAEACLRRLAEVVDRSIGSNLAGSPGAGAAGGLGFGLMAFAGAHVQSGFDLYAREAGLKSHLCWADLVVSGEGAVDDSTLMGKGVGGVAQRAQALGLPCLALGGSCRPSPRLRERFALLAGIVPDLAPLAEARLHPGRWLRRLAEAVARDRAWESRCRKTDA